MNSLEIMEKATSYTMGKYMNTYYNVATEKHISYSELEKRAIDFSGKALMKVLYASDGMCKDYTREGNLRYDMAQLGGDAIKYELLKNIVNVAIYHKINNTKIGNIDKKEWKEDMSDDEIAMMVFNNIVDDGIDKGYSILNNGKVLESCCRTFANYRREGKKEVLDNIASNNNLALEINHELDLYYARYGNY